MTDLLNGHEIEIPDFNFKTGKREYNGNKMKLGEMMFLLLREYMVLMISCHIHFLKKANIKYI